MLVAQEVDAGELAGVVIKTSCTSSSSAVEDVLSDFEITNHSMVYICSLIVHGLAVTFGDVHVCDHLNM